MFRPDHEGLAVLIEEESDTGRSECRSQQPRVGEHHIEIEVLDHLERAPDLLPAAAAAGCVEYLHEGPLERRHPRDTAGMAMLRYRTAQVGDLTKAAAGHELKFSVQIQVGTDKAPPEEVIEKINGILDGIKKGMRLE